MCCLILWEIHLSTLLPGRMLGLLLLGKVGFFVAAIDELEAVAVAIDEFVVVSNDELVAVVTPQNFQVMEQRALLFVASPNFNVAASFVLLYYVVLAVEDTCRGLHSPLLLLLSTAVSLSCVDDKEAACSIPVVHCVTMLLPGKREGSARFVMVEDRRQWRSATRTCEDENPRLACEKMRTHLSAPCGKATVRGGPGHQCRRG